MKFQPKILSACMGAVFLSGCASVATRLPEISLPELKAETVNQEDLALTAFNEQAEALMAVSYPILQANMELCPKVRPDIGVWVHSQKDYDKRLRTASERILGAAEDNTVFQIAPDSPAAKAGIEIGDQIMGPKGQSLGPRDKEMLELLGGKDEVELTVKRGGRIKTIGVKPVQICNYGLTLSQSAAINAYATGSRITMTTGMMDFVESEDELALIVGHELAHNTMGHIRKIIGNLIITGLATRYTRPFESEADYVGLYYQVRAGYSPENVEDFWRRLAKVNPKSVGRAKTHPTFPDRYLRLAAAREEILAKQAAGESMIPNFKSADNND